MGNLREMARESAAMVHAEKSTLAVEWVGIAGAIVALWLLIGRQGRLRTAIPLDAQSVPEKDLYGPRVSAIVPRDIANKPRLVRRLESSVRTMYDVFRLGLKLSSDGPCLGYKEFHSYKYITYSQVLSKAKEFGSGLMALGLDPNPKTRVGIYAVNCPEWVIAEQAAYTFSMCVVPLSESFSPQVIADIINDANVTLVICDNEIRCLTLLDNTPISLKTIVLMKTPGWATEEKAEENNIILKSFDKVIEMGKSLDCFDRPPNDDDVCTLCYSSGTTGDPKGVVLTHKNMLAAISGVMLQLDEHKPVQTDVLMSFLPLSQIQERCAEYCMFMAGGAVGFFGGDIQKLKYDMKLLRPTIVTAVPRILNSLYNKSMDDSKRNWLKKMLIISGLSAKHEELKRGIIRNDNFWDYVIFKKNQRDLGGNVRLVVVGSASVRPEVLTFLRCTLGCAVVEGYGQSECAGGITMTVVGDHVPGHVGPPLPSCSIKLVDVPDMDFFATKDRGEICVKGPSVFSTYLHEVGSMTIDQDGWHHTGDIGQWLPNGTLKIIGRKVDTFKLSNGYFVSPEKLEEVFSRSFYVSQICVYGDSMKSNLVAIVVPDMGVVKSWAKEHEVEGELVELCQHPVFKMRLMDSLEACGKVAGLKPIEFVKDVIVHNEPFSIENGLLTPSKKTRRFKVIENFRFQIKQMYDQFRQ